jgi:hypothetical protein
LQVEVEVEEHLLVLLEEEKVVLEQASGFRLICSGSTLNV